MLKTHIKLKPLLASILFVFASTTASAGLAYASNANANNNKPAGNNGTIKIDGTDIDQLHDNDPHVACTFSVNWFGFDEGTRNTTVTFDAQEPTSKDQLLTQDSTFTGSGAGNTLDFSNSYDLTSALSGYTPQPQQGYHVKLTVTTDGSQGNDTKSKVFWVGPCATTVETQTVTATAPGTTTPTCGLQTETVTPPSISGITWSPSGVTVLSAGQSITYTATANSGYALADGSQNSWTFTNSFDNSDCGQTQGDTTTLVTPTEPDHTTPSCQVQSETVTPPNIPGVVWSPNGPTVLNSSNLSVTYTATPDTGYSFPAKIITSWTYNYVLDADCSSGQVLGDEVVVVTPGDPDPIFTDATCSAGGSYTVVAKDGVIYKDADGNEVQAGTYSVANGTTITITAYPANDSVEFSRDAQTVWTHTFNPPTCTHVLGDSTSSTTPHVLGAQATLLNTGPGASPVLTTFFATTIIALTMLVRSSTPKRAATRKIPVKFL